MPRCCSAPVLFLVLGLLVRPGAASGESSPPGPDAAPALPRSVELLFTSDTRGRLLPLVTGGTARGGVALRSSHLDVVRREGPSLLLSAGNFLFPGHLGTLDQGVTVVECYDRMGYAAAGVGPEDLELGVEVLRQRARQAGFPLLCANLIRPGATFVPTVSVGSAPPATGTTFPLCPGVVLRTEGLWVGVTSVIDPAVVKATRGLAGTVTAVPALEAARAQASALREHGAEVVVVLSSAGFRQSLELAALPDVNLVLCTRGAAGDPTFKGLDECRLSGGKVVAQTPGGGLHLGRMTLGVDEGEVRLGPARFVAVDENLPPDPELERLVEALDLRLTEANAVRVTELATDAAPVFDIVCLDVARERLDCEVALVNRGFFQGEASPGPLYVIDLQRILPFGDTLARLSVRGSVLRALVSSRGGEVVVSGLEKVGADWTVNGRLLKDDVTYRVATTSFVARGGNGLLDAPAESTDLVVRTVVRRRLERLPLVTDRSFRSLRRRPVHSLSLRLGADLSRLTLNPAVADYAARSVPGLGTTPTTKLRGSLASEFRVDTVPFDLTASLGAKYEETDDVRTIDQLLLGFVYERKTRLSGSRPFVGVELDTTVTGSALDGRDRPYKVKLTAGGSYPLSRYLKGRAGLSSLVQAGSLTGDTTYGSDLTLEYGRSHPGGVEVRSRVNHFLSYAGLIVNQVRWETELSVRVHGRLSFRSRADVFLYRDDEVGTTARSAEIYMGLGYDVAMRRW